MHRIFHPLFIKENRELLINIKLGKITHQEKLHTPCFIIQTMEYSTTLNPLEALDTSSRPQCSLIFPTCTTAHHLKQNKNEVKLKAKAIMRKVLILSKTSRMN